MNILVLGASGMAGHVISLVLRENGFDVDTLSSKNLLDKDTVLIDVMNLKELQNFLERKKYEVVINCIGVLVKQSDERKDLASYLNAFLPHFLENFYKNSGTKVIHLSTDCVFSGENPPYQEDSAYDGKLFYDRSKALGEIINNKDLTFRMSIIGPDLHFDGIGLFNWFLGQTGQISGYTKTIWSGITTIELAKGIIEAINQNLTGLYHLVPNTNISKFDLLNIIKHTFRRDDISIEPNDDIVIDKTLVNTRKDFNFVVNDYQKMIEEMLVWISQHKNLYPHYKTIDE